MQLRGRTTWLAAALWLVVPAAANAQGFPPPPTAEVAAEVRSVLAAMKADERGPFQRIRWYCNDGTVHAPEGTPCRERGGGAQHAEHSAAADRLARLDFHVGTILQATSYDEFADTARAGYRLREMVLERYLIGVDDGWVLRRARYYRGALQIEDEERAGRALLEQRFTDGPGSAPTTSSRRDSRRRCLTRGWATPERWTGSARPRSRYRTRTPASSRPG